MLQLQEETAHDPELAPLKDIILQRCPEAYKDLKVLKPYWSYREELYIEEFLKVSKY